MTPRIRTFVLGLSVLGLAFAGAASYVHYRLLTVPNYVSPCDINARFNCSEVYLSRYGSIHGVPVALGGVLFFAVVLALALFSPPKSSRVESATGSYIFALSTIGLATILYLGWASFFVLKTGCILCIGTYVAVIGLFVVSGSASEVPILELPGRALRDARALVGRPMPLFVTLLLVAAASSMFACFPNAAGDGTARPAATTGAPGDEQNFDAIWAQQPRIDLGIPADGAKVVIVKFNDWQCPSCKAAYYSYKATLDKYVQAGTVKYVTKDYPLNPKCNFNISTAMHAGACEAAAAARLATEQGKGDAMVEWLFGHQEGLTPESVSAEVKTLLGTTDFTAEYNRLLPDIKRDAADGGVLKVIYTPTYYVNGVKAQLANGSFIDPRYLEYAIQYEIAHPVTPAAGAATSPGGK